jgi:predicted Rossmann-fold nucleotide-binding protein
MQSFPVIVMGKDYWDELEDFIRKRMIKEGTIDEEELDLVTFTDATEEAVEIIQRCAMVPA